MKNLRWLKVFRLGVTFALVMSLNGFAGDLEMTKITMGKANWGYFSDQVMGGKSQGRAQFLDEADGQFVRLQGDVTTVNNGGFIQIRTPVSDLGKEVRGNGQKYYVFIRTSGTMLPWHYYKAAFPSKMEWSEVNLEFKSFVRSSSWLSKIIKPDSIKSIGIVAFGRDHKALIDIGDINFF